MKQLKLLESSTLKGIEGLVNKHIFELEESSKKVLGIKVDLYLIEGIRLYLGSIIYE